MININFLSDDICRCNDENCLEKDSCLRFLRRKDPGWIAQTDSLRAGSELCEYKINNRLEEE
jgi:hypothetical protein